MELPTIQPRQPQASDTMIPSSPPIEGTDVLTSRQTGTSKPSTDATIVAQTLKEKTGFPTYPAFLEKNGYEHLGILTRATGRRDSDQNAEPHCAIIDLSGEKLPMVKVSLRCVNLSATETLLALSEPPKDVSVQVVVLSLPRRHCMGLASEFPGILGLGLNLTPRFFAALTAQLERHTECEVANNARFQCKYLLASGTVVAIARQFLLAKPGSPPVVLIAGPPRIHDLSDQDSLYEMLSDGLPTDESVGKDQFPEDYDPDSEGATCYTRLLSFFVEHKDGCASCCDDLLLASLLPLLQLDILRIRELCTVIRSYFVRLKSPTYKNTGQDTIERLIPSPGDDETPEVLYRYRTVLRSAMEQCEDETEPLKAFVSSQIGEHLTSSSAFIRIVTNRQRILKEACRLEAEIRDYLQVQAGHLALLESRKSIELSNYQIWEGKRVKIFTILAFVYVPLNLATSVFGMNLQQLNGSGRGIGDFIGTAALALALTGGMWWFMEQLSYLLAWRKRGAQAQPHRERHPDYAISVRLTMIAWLVCNGHWSWMHKSGAGRNILANSGTGFCCKYRYTAWTAASENLAAGDYVSKFANRDPDWLDEEYAISPFDTRAGHWLGPKIVTGTNTKSPV